MNNNNCGYVPSCTGSQNKWDYCVDIHDFDYGFTLLPTVLGGCASRHWRLHRVGIGCDAAYVVEGCAVPCDIKVVVLLAAVHHVVNSCIQLSKGCVGGGSSRHWMLHRIIVSSASES